VFLGERLELVETIGILITVSGIAWVVTEKQGGKTVVENKNYSRGLIFGFLGALGQASGLIAAKFGLVDNFPTISATSIRILVALVILWVLAAFRRRVSDTLKSWRNRQAFWALIGGTVVGPFLGIWLSLVAVQLAPVGIAATLMALPPIIIIPINYILYREGVNIRSGFGTVLAFAGVGLILLPT
jgi:drug/metabolite transporter (DMT)-like permease